MVQLVGLLIRLMRLRCCRHGIRRRQWVTTSCWMQSWIALMQSAIKFDTEETLANQLKSQQMRLDREAAARIRGLS